MRLPKTSVWCDTLTICPVLVPHGRTPRASGDLRVVCTTWQLIRLILPNLKEPPCTCMTSSQLLVCAQCRGKRLPAFSPTNDRQMRAKGIKCCTREPANRQAVQSTLDLLCALTAIQRPAAMGNAAGGARDTNLARLYARGPGGTLLPPVDALTHVGRFNEIPFSLPRGRAAGASHGSRALGAGADTAKATAEAIHPALDLHLASAVAQDVGPDATALSTYAGLFVTCSGDGVSPDQPRRAIDICIALDVVSGLSLMRLRGRHHDRCVQHVPLLTRNPTVADHMLSRRACS